MVKVIISLALLLFSNLLIGQVTFQITYGGTGDQKGNDVQQTFDGGYIIAGAKLNINNDYDICLIKTNYLGDTIWNKIYNSTGFSQSFHVQQTSDSGYAVIGYTNIGTTSDDLYFIKTDSLGNLLWRKTYGSYDQDRGYSFRQTFDGGFIIAGGVWNLGVSGNNMYILKTNSIGDTLWTRVIANTSPASGIIQTSDSGYVVTGSHNSSICLAKLNNSGGVLWIKYYYIGGSNSFGHSVQQTNDGGFLISGDVYLNAWTFHLIKTDSIGNLNWVKTYGGISNWGCTALQTSDGEYAFCGTSYNTDPEGDFTLVKINSTGDTLWTRVYGGSGSDWTSSLWETNDNGFIIVGRSYSWNPNGDIYLVKTDSLGLTNCFVNTNPLIVSVPVAQTFNLPITVASGGTVSAPVITTSNEPFIATSCLVNNLNEPLSPNHLFIGPNPFNNELNIYFEITRRNQYSISISNIFGVLIFSRKYSDGNNNTLELSYLEKGIYILEIYNGSDRFIRKIVKQ